MRSSGLDLTDEPLRIFDQVVAHIEPQRKGRSCDAADVSAAVDAAHAHGASVHSAHMPAHARTSACSSIQTCNACLRRCCSSMTGWPTTGCRSHHMHETSRHQALSSPSLWGRGVLESASSRSHGQPRRMVRVVVQAPAGDAIAPRIELWTDCKVRNLALRKQHAERAKGTSRLTYWCRTRSRVHGQEMVLCWSKAGTRRLRSGSSFMGLLGHWVGGVS